MAKEAGVLGRGAWMHYGPYQVASGSALVARLAGSEDADLYIRKTVVPTPSSYDCRPYRPDSHELCEVAGPGTYYASVNGWAPSSKFVLEVDFGQGTMTAAGVLPPEQVRLEVADVVSPRELKRYSVPVSDRDEIILRTLADKDVDLFIQMDEPATRENHLVRTHSTSGHELIACIAPSSGTLHIMIDAPERTAFTLVVSSR